ncbi:hypothetical protein BaRGS_00014707 [Batillaria attramentaria]|uniref:Sulfotransferase domain-containing protein n=1 Tax=Batillaria attramentaria TaxID=370345 RepID=A0ABD0L4K4_9CAEN
MTLRPDDVLMCSFPKAGSHWLWEVCSMLRQGKSVYENRPKIQLMIDFVDVEEIDEQPSPRTLNTHLPFSMLPVQEIKDKRTKIVHVYRNPKAVVVSMYFMAKTAGFAIADLKFGDFVDYFLSSQAPYGGYFGFLQQMNEFTQNNPDVPVLNVSYEGMIKDPVTNIRQLAKFLEVDVSDKLCEEIAEACSFQNMKNNFIEKSPARFGGGHVGDFQGGPGGETDDWKNYLTVAMSEKLDAVAMEKMKGLPFTLHYT